MILSNGMLLFEETYYDTELRVVGYVKAEGVVEIPSSFKGRPVTGIAASAFNSCKTITSVIIPDGVVDIGDKAFLECENLTSVVMSDSVTKIGENAFEYLDNLKAIVVPESVSRINDWGISDCYNLKKIFPFLI